MSDTSIFDISASGMALERLRLQIEALNLANANTTRTQSGGVYRPLTVISSPKYSSDFSSVMSGLIENKDIPLGVKVDSVQRLDLPPKVVYDPSNPDANKNGYVKYPNINPVTEMVKLINVTRSYEANVRAFNAAKRMMQSAMDIGGK